MTALPFGVDKGCDDAVGPFPGPPLRRTAGGLELPACIDDQISDEIKGPAGVVFAQTASAAGGTSCAKGSGTATFTPGLFKLQPAATAQTHEATSTISATGTVSGCSGGGVVSGTTTSTIKIADPTNCNSLLDSKEPPASPATVGTLTVKWNNGKTSTVGALTLTSVPGQSTQANLSGKVTGGTLFKGLTVTARVSFKPTTSNQCVTANLTKVTYTGVTAFKVA